MCASVNHGSSMARQTHGVQPAELRLSLGSCWPRFHETFPSFESFSRVWRVEQKESWDWLPLVSDALILILRESEGESRRIPD